MPINLVNTYLWAGFIIWIYMTVAYLVAVKIKRNDIADIAWGLGFILASWVGLVVNDNFSAPALLAYGLVTIWGMRLGLHVLSRNVKKPEDYRYKAWRDSWGKWFVVRSYLQIFILQGLLMLVVVSPVLVIATYANGEITPLIILACLLWLIGFMFESVGDKQLKDFISNPDNRGQIMQTGLWKYSRHPNYFGEIMQWWALGLYAISYNYGFLGMIGPLVITYLILYVSGVPMLEKKYANNAQFQKYAQRTSKLFPLPSKKS